MRAAVIGTNWGRVHVAALREAGVEVVALAALSVEQARAAAEQLHVPVATADLASLHGLDLDLVTVATPATSHAAVIAELPDVPVLCEKPAVGLAPLAPLPGRRSQPVWVNYAFAHLDVAGRASAALDRIGTPLRAQVTSAHDLPELAFDAPAMWCELVPHPWSWLVTLLGSPEAGAAPGPAAGSPSEELAIGAVSGGVPMRLAARQVPGLAGIRHHVVLEGILGRLEVAGSSRGGAPWTYDPPTLVRADGSREQLGEAEAGPGDAWYRANARAIAAVVDAVRGQHADPRLFDWERALTLDAVAQEGLRAG